LGDNSHIARVISQAVATRASRTTISLDDLVRQSRSTISLDRRRFSTRNRGANPPARALLRRRQLRQPAHRPADELALVVEAVSLDVRDLDVDGDQRALPAVAVSGLVERDRDRSRRGSGQVHDVPQRISGLSDGAAARDPAPRARSGSTSTPVRRQPPLEAQLRDEVPRCRTAWRTASCPRRPRTGAHYAIWEPKWQVEGFVDWTMPDRDEYADYPPVTTATGVSATSSSCRRRSRRCESSERSVRRSLQIQCWGPCGQGEQAEHDRLQVFAIRALHPPPSSGS
jgi:hypothetical protein